MELDASREDLELIIKDRVELRDIERVRRILRNVFRDTESLFVLFHSSSNSSVDRTRENTSEGSEILRLAIGEFLTEAEKFFVLGLQ